MIGDESTRGKEWKPSRVLEFSKTHHNVIRGRLDTVIIDNLHTQHKVGKIDKYEHGLKLLYKYLSMSKRHNNIS